MLLVCAKRLLHHIPLVLAILPLKAYSRVKLLERSAGMKKALTILFLSLSFVIILDVLNAGEAIFMFVLAGVIPGTNIAIDATRMLEAFTLLIGFTLSRVTTGLMSANAQRHTEQAMQTTRVIRTRTVRA